MKSVFSYAAILKATFADVRSVHLQTDLSDRNGESRMSMWLTFARAEEVRKRKKPTQYEQGQPTLYCLSPYCVERLDYF
jgi:hypothetical protein